VVWYDRSFRRGNRGARFAKFAQLARISKWLSKFMFATIAFVEAVSLIIYISKRNDQIELYETLLYRVKRKST